MNDIMIRCAKLAADATSLRTDAEFRASFAMCNGQMTEAHLTLYRAQRAVRAAADAVDRVVAEADSHLALQEAAE